MINVLLGRQTFSCWTLAGCGQLRRVGWSLTSLPQVICGWWALSTTWACRSVWRPAAVRACIAHNVACLVKSTTLDLALKHAASFWHRAEHQLQGRGARGTWRSVGEAAFHGGVLQSQRSAYPHRSLHRWETSAAEPQPIHTATGGIQRLRPSRSVWRPLHRHWATSDLIEQ